MKRRIITLVAGTLSLGLLVGTWAFYSATNTIDNQLKTKAYGDTLEEKFTPDENWEPGEEVTKEVGVTNTGDYDLVVRVKLNEEWTRGTTSLIAIDSTGASGADQVKINYDLANRANQYDFNGGGSGPTDGMIEDGTYSDETIVYKEMNNIGLGSGKWTLHSDGWWYYNDILSAGQTTNELLSSIMLAKDADMGKYDVTNYYTTDFDVSEEEPVASNIGSNPAIEWVRYSDAVPVSTSEVYTRAVSKLSNKAGYAGAVYDLYITSETCQATKDAVTDKFSGAPTNLWPTLP